MPSVGLDVRGRIDRIALFRAKPGLHLRPDHTFDDEEYNTYACPWHHNLTAAVLSFRTAKALKSNPGSTYAIQPVVFDGMTGDLNPTDLDFDGIRDLDGLEYSMAPDATVIPRWNSTMCR